VEDAVSVMGEFTTNNRERYREKLDFEQSALGELMQLMGSSSAISIWR